MDLCKRETLIVGRGRGRQDHEKREREVSFLSQELSQHGLPEGTDGQKLSLREATVRSPAG